MDILLAHGYFLSEDPHERRIMKPYPPLGILYLSAYLKARGIAVSVFDSTFRSLEEFERVLDSAKPAVVGIYANLMTKLAVLSMIKLCKARGCKVVLGGPDPPAHAQSYLDLGTDVVVVGEGEQTLAEVVETLQTGGTLQLRRVAGIIFRDDEGRIEQTPARPLIPDLDSLPVPDREAIDLDRYVATWRQFHGRGSVSLITARGCPYTCAWCSHGVYGFSHRRRSPRKVVDEVELLRDRYHPDMLWIADDVFTINHRWIAEYSREMKLRNLRIPFECISRADRLTEEVLTAMEDLGCFRVWIGSESGSQRILDGMSRGVSVKEIQHATRLAQRHGIEVGLFVMLGYESETIQDIEATIDHLVKTRADTFLTTVAYPIKGTRYFEEIESRVEAQGAWSHRTDRQLTVHGRYPDIFYWFAQRRMTNAVRYRSIEGWSPGKGLERMLAFGKSTIAQMGMAMTSFWRS